MPGRVLPAGDDGASAAHSADGIASAVASTKRPCGIVGAEDAQLNALVPQFLSVIPAGWSSAARTRLAGLAGVSMPATVCRWSSADGLTSQRAAQATSDRSTDDFVFQILKSPRPSELLG